MGDGVVAEHTEFLASSPKRQKERQHESDEDQPRRNRDANRDPAGVGPQHEADRNRDNVGDHDLFRITRVKKLQRYVQSDDREEAASKRETQADARRSE